MEFDIKMISDPDCFAEGRLPARTYFDAMQPDENGGFKTSVVLDLNGEWKFEYARNYESCHKDFYKPEIDCATWDEIHVPGHIQMQGYDKPHYTNTAYPWDGLEDVPIGEVPKEFNPVGNYVKYFECPHIPDGYDARIYFGGIESGGAIWLNGHFIGYKEDSFDAGEYDITQYLVPGTNKLAVQVFKWTVGSWFEDQDFFRFSGIYRKVYIYSVPASHIEDIGIRTLLDDEYKDAVLKLKLIGRGEGSADILLTDAKGIKIFDDTLKLMPEISADYNVSAPNLWSAEKPYLYELTVTVKDMSGQVTEKVTQNVGFRRFEMIDGIMCINGKRIEFNGVNRHEFSCFTGRSVTYEETLTDVLTMKAHNINAIRTSHYPDDQDLYDLCDKYGLYMIAENNMETHGTWCVPSARENPDQILPGDHMEYEPLLLDRVRSCYEIHKNHPAILIWSDGNESFGGKVIADMSDLFRKLDPDRLVHYESIFHDRRYPETSDMETQMYTPVAEVKKFLDENPGKPFIMCEYTHAMGNSCGGMHKYTEFMHSEPRFQGGFIWDYIDQSIVTTDRYGDEYQGYGGDFGDRPSEYNFSGNGIVYGDRTPSPKMQEVKYNYRPIECKITEDKVIVINRHLFTNTSEYDCVITVLKDGEEIKKASLKTDVEPLSECEYDLPFKAPEETGEYTYIVSFGLKEDTDYAAAGHEVAFDQFAFEHGEKYSVRAAACESTINPPVFVPGHQNYGEKGDDFQILFTPGQGGIASYVYGGKEYIYGNKVPVPNFWRAPVDNDMGNTGPQRYAQWKIASMYLTHKKTANFDIMIPQILPGPDGLCTEFTHTLPTSPETNVRVRYEVRSDGSVDTTLIYDSVKELHDMPEFGMMFTFDADMSHVRWYGRGPEETYADRCGGGKLGIWENDVTDNMASYLVPQECGNKTDVRWGEVYGDDGHGIRFTSLGEPMYFSALPYTPHEMENAAHAHELPPIYHTVVRVSLKQMGIGGDDSWGARVHPEFLLGTPEHMEFMFRFKGF
ncbi:MAG: DUF4981 domain-containing protein [Lachnospiraceae bacterium]|nr:DUF4981 domain-containing protein [Lachnospiraceae bacterium]